MGGVDEPRSLFSASVVGGVGALKLLLNEKGEGVGIVFASFESVAATKDLRRGFAWWAVCCILWRGWQRRRGGSGRGWVVENRSASMAIEMQMVSQIIERD